MMISKMASVDAVEKSFLFYHIYSSLNEPLHLILILSLCKPLFGHRLVFVGEEAYIAGLCVCICLAKDTVLSQACNLPDRQV